jgi:hypothetical protein
MVPPHPYWIKTLADIFQPSDGSAEETEADLRPAARAGRPHRTATTDLRVLGVPFSARQRSRLLRPSARVQSDQRRLGAVERRLRPLDSATRPAAGRRTARPGSTSCRCQRRPVRWSWTSTGPNCRPAPSPTPSSAHYRQPRTGAKDAGQPHSLAANRRCGRMTRQVPTSNAMYVHAWRCTS